MKAREPAMKDMFAMVRNFFAAGRGKRFFVLALLLVGAGIAYSPLSAPGWFWSHDSYTHLQRLYATCYEMRQGDLYPRWLSQAAYGKGLPGLNFYSPAFYLIVGWVHLLGVPLETALKGLCFAVFFLGAWGMYAWIRRHSDIVGALIAAVLYLFTPYHFLDIYVRGAYPEFAALALLPWLFHALDLSFSPEKCLRGITLTAITSAGIALTHHLTTLMVVPFAVLYFGWHAASARTDYRRILIAAVGPALGAGLSAFYWLPMVTEMRYLVNFKNSHAIWDHFVYPSQFIFSDWGFGASVPGPGDAMSFRIGAVLLGVGALAFFMLPLIPRNERIFGIVTLSLALFGIFMTTSLSSALYDLFPPMQYFRHPWRFLGPGTMFLAAFAGLITRSRPLSRFSWTRWLLFIMISIACIVVSSDQRTVHSRSIDLDLAEAVSIENRAIGGTTYDADFMPKWAKYDPARRVYADIWVWPSADLARVSRFEMKGAAMKVSMAARRPIAITVPWFYFPGWQMTVNGISFPVDVDRNGFITFKVGAGTYDISLWFGSTWPRIAGWVIAGVACLILCGFTLPRVRRWVTPHVARDA
jgi:hypothetical protein